MCLVYWSIMKSSDLQTVRASKLMYMALLIHYGRMKQNETKSELPCRGKVQIFLHQNYTYFPLEKLDHI